MVVGPQLRVRIALADPLGSAPQAATMQQYIRENLGFLPFVSLVDSASIPGGAGLPAASGESGMDFRRFQLAGAHVLLTALWNGTRAELRAFDVTLGKFIFGRAYTVTQNNVGDEADNFCADLLQALTGRGEFFRSTIAFVKSDGPGKKDIWAVKPTGRNLRRLTNLPGNALSPSWSPDGRFVIFSHVDRRTHGLGVWDSSTLATQRMKFPGNTVIGPAFMPNHHVAVSLSDGRNPSIFLLDHSFRRLRTLESSASIDVSPSIDATGTKMAFVSSRMGNPHIFLKDLSTGAVTRISYEGKYNTEPSISPDGTLIAFSRQMGGGHRIFVHDLMKKTETQISFGPGSDEQPAFAPDNYFIAFTSTRSGTQQLYLLTRNGGEPKRIPTGPGNASFAAWGLFQR
jgi:TolB protein